VSTAAANTDAAKRPKVASATGWRMIEFLCKGRVRLLGHYIPRALGFRTGNTQSFSYGWLGPVTFNPSAGLLLKFTGDLVYLVLIRDSNLDLVPPNRAVNLTDRGINRHRIFRKTTTAPLPLK
jgi:hypothetical protein